MADIVAFGIIVVLAVVVPALVYGLLDENLDPKFVRRTRKDKK